MYSKVWTVRLVWMARSLRDLTCNPPTSSSNSGAGVYSHPRVRTIIFKSVEPLMQISLRNFTFERELLGVADYLSSNPCRKSLRHSSAMWKGFALRAIFYVRAEHSLRCLVDIIPVHFYSQIDQRELFVKCISLSWILVLYYEMLYCYIMKCSKSIHLTEISAETVK
jgi:hypothetical protein